MSELFSGQFSPITSEIGFLRCSAETAVEAFVAWQTPIQKKRGVSLSITKEVGHLDKQLNRLLPLTSVEHRRMLFVPTAGEWTAYFDNGWQGADVYSHISYLSMAIGCNGIRASYT